MKRDQDEIRINELFGKINTPQYDILKGVTKMKRYRRPRLSVAVAAAALTIILTAGAVLAAYYGTGGFGRLRGIVGDYHADMLTPIEEVLGAEEAGFTTPFIPGYNPTHDEFRIEIVAINISENRDYMYIYATLDDLTGDRANCDFFNLNFSLHTPNNTHMYDGMYDFNGLVGHFRANDVIHRDENGILTLRTRQELRGRQDVFINDEITITFHELAYNETGYIDNHVIDIDLSTISLDTPFTRTVFEGGNWSRAVQFCEYENEYVFYILEPFNLDIPVGIDGIRTRISSIGIINGNLHVQTYQPRPSYIAFSALDLQHSSSRRMRSCYSTIFNLSPEGVAYNKSFARESIFPIFRGFFSINDFQEYVWTNVDVSNLANLQLTGIFSDSYRVWLDWTTTFSVK